MRVVSVVMSERSVILILWWKCDGEVLVMLWMKLFCLEETEMVSMNLFDECSLADREESICKKMIKIDGLK